jgi:ABC-type Fe3+/spermidine/putrescine transport system ATPase subunit
VHVAIRPEHVHLAPAGEAPRDAAIPATVAELAYLGHLNDYQVALADGTRLRVQAHPLSRFEAGERVLVRVDEPQVIVFP